MEYLLSHLLVNSAVRYPDREAVRMNGVSLTYAELDQAANQVARTLLGLGVKRGGRVGIYLHKSIASIISVFGVMKAGAAYVPLDPNAPVRRLAYIARDCEVKVILASTRCASKLPDLQAEGAPLQSVVLMDSESSAIPEVQRLVKVVTWQEVQTCNAEAVDLSESIDSDLAYILYTSGSTGSPKGVMIAHRTILTFVKWAVEEFGMTSEDRVTSHAPLHFDLSTFDIYATIKAGGTIIPIAENLSALPVKLADLLESEGVTITYLVPSILSFMTSYGKLDSHNFACLRAILFAGEVFHIKYLRRLASAVPHAALYNLYGPTETNVCTFYKVQPTDLKPDCNQSVPIGQACSNVEVFAVQEDGSRVTEPGQEGELWARGACVAQGYWGDPEKTSRAFVQSPFNPIYSDVAYRTGDIVTLAPDLRNWIYVGRRDHMVKSRGYRIELGEIENALHRHDEVKEAAVVAIQDELVGSRIWAFVSLVEGSSVTSQDLEIFCATLVPKYMVPERFEFRTALPKTSSGKINRPFLLEGTTPA